MTQVLFDVLYRSPHVLWCTPGPCTAGVVLPKELAALEEIIVKSQLIGMLLIVADTVALQCCIIVCFVASQASLICTVTGVKAHQHQHGLLVHAFFHCFRCWVLYQGLSMPIPVFDVASTRFL